MTAAWRAYPEVAAVSLIGSVARDPWKEVPRFAPYRRARIELWHECKDVDLALWLSATGNLNSLRRARARALNMLMRENDIGVASHQVDVLVLEPGTDRYIGRLCDYNACPKGKPECRTPGCGTSNSCACMTNSSGGRRPSRRAAPFGLFDRAGDLYRLAVDLPLPGASGHRVPLQ